MCYSPATAWFSGVQVPGRGEVPVCATALLQPGSQAYRSRARVRCLCATALLQPGSQTCRFRAGAGVPPTNNPVRGGICFNGKFVFLRPFVSRTAHS